MNWNTADSSICEQKMDFKTLGDNIVRPCCFIRKRAKITPKFLVRVMKQMVMVAFKIDYLGRGTSSFIEKSFGVDRHQLGD